MTPTERDLLAAVIREPGPDDDPQAVELTHKNLTKKTFPFFCPEF